MKTRENKEDEKIRKIYVEKNIKENRHVYERREKGREEKYI